MPDFDGSNNPVVHAGEQLFQFAIDRGDMHAILDAMPGILPDKRGVLEYEIQMLRIISVGWAIAFFVEEFNIKTALGEHYWDHISAFSSTLSASASLTTGSEVVYFDTLKQRLDFYIGCLEAAGRIPEPVMAIGPAFAMTSGDPEDACAILAGSKMFSLTINAVREYLAGAIAQQN